jgi:acetolactate synthase-1/2/3 large subunit
MTIRKDVLVVADAKDTLEALIEGLKETDHRPTSSWLAQCKQWKMRYPVHLPEYSQTKDAINIYTFVDMLSRLAGEHDCILSDAGSAFYAVSQGLQLRAKTQRYIPSSAMATMGFSLPASIGAALVRPHARTLAITGDGSFQQNIQELQTLLHYQLPVALFVLNNDGYLSIRASQKNYFHNRWIGEGPRSGVTMPDTLKISEAYGIPAKRVASCEELEDVIVWARDVKGPCVVDVITPPDQLIIPTVASRINEDGTMSSRPLEDMFPFLDREEYRANLLIPEV